MLSYLIRRILLFFPTLIGATAVIFLLMAASPVNIVDVLLPPGGAMRPGERAAREAYLDERYGLGKPPTLQYLRWLNNISPVGFRTWKRDDPPVAEAKAKEAALKADKEREMAAAGATPADIERAVKRIDVGPDAGDPRLNKPALKVPDPGHSFVQSRPVWPVIRQALPVTIMLQLVSLPVSMAIALLTGVWSAQHRGKFQDVFTGTLLIALYALPTIWVGTLMVGFLANVHYVKAFPAEGLHDMRSAAMPFFPRFGDGGFERGYLLDTTWHLLLPVICISYGTIAFYSKLARTSLLETLGMDYVRTARAKGLAEKVVLYRHAFRNSLLPLITVAASFLPLLVTGSIVVETIFGINGMGRLTISALKANDRELFLSTSVIILLLQLGGYLIADILYAVADPRVSYDNR